MVGEKRVVLRSYRIEDAEVVWEALEESRDSLIRWTPDLGRLRTEDDVRAGLTNLTSVQRERMIFAVWDQPTERFLGEVGIYAIDRSQAVGEVGYWLRATARRQGYLSEALDVLLRRVVMTGLMHSVQARIPFENHASRRLVERSGFSIAAQFCSRREWEASTENMLLYTRRLV
jgi:RimJ/RimL family protein N-acetyltransferase